MNGEFDGGQNIGDEINNDFEEDLKKNFKPPKKKGFLHNILSFENMLTPKIVKILYFVGIILSIIIGLSFILVDETAVTPTGEIIHFNGTWIGLAIIILGPIIIRIYSEFAILRFKIYYELKDINKKVQ